MAGPSAPVHPDIDYVVTKVNSYWGDKYDDDNDDEGYPDDPWPSRRDAAAQPPKVRPSPRPPPASLSVLCPWCQHVLLSLFVRAAALDRLHRLAPPQVGRPRLRDGRRRNIANKLYADDASMLAVLEYAVLEYAVHTLKVHRVVVEGHTDRACIQASIEAAHTARAARAGPASPTTPLARWLAPLTVLAADLPPPCRFTHGINSAISAQRWRDSLRDRALLLIEQNVAAQVTGVVRVLGALQPLDRPVHVHGLVYDLEQRELGNLDVSVTVGGSGGGEVGAAA